MIINRFQSDHRVGNSHVPDPKAPIQDIGSSTELSPAPDKVELGTTPEPVTISPLDASRSSSETSDTKPIGMEGTLKLLQQIRDQAKQAEPVRQEQPAAAVQPTEQVAFHLPPDEQWNLMRDNHGSLGQVKEVYRGMASHANEGNQRRTEIYKDLGDSLSQIWTKTRSISHGRRGEAF